MTKKHEPLRTSGRDKLSGFLNAAHKTEALIDPAGEFVRGTLHNVSRKLDKYPTGNHVVGSTGWLSRSHAVYGDFEVKVFGSNTSVDTEDRWFQASFRVQDGTEDLEIWVDTLEPPMIGKESGVDEALLASLEDLNVIEMLVNDL